MSKKEDNFITYMQEGKNSKKVEKVKINIWCKYYIFF